MKFVSTRGQGEAVSLSRALRLGAAPDGGLFMPAQLPRVDWTVLDPERPLAHFAADLLRHFFAGDPLAASLDAICAATFSFPVPLVTPDGWQPRLQALELFHGPTGAFKDFGARFLLAAFDHLAGPEPLTVLAATSGDTGGAVGCAAEGRGSVRAVILYPRGRVSPFQLRQLTCWGEPVSALEVDGDFDSCQALAKAAFRDAPLSARHRLTSANSINLGRLLPQMAYSAHAAVRVAAETGARPGFIVPTGNLGHGFAVLLARALGAPIGPVILATNANPTLAEWATSGQYSPRPALTTIANAMDVGDPSNFERLRFLGIKPEDVQVERVGDEAIRARIAADYARAGYVWCPHSAIAAEAWWRLPKAQREERPWIAAATAHPAKFAEVVEPLIGRQVTLSEPLARIIDRPTARRRIAPTLAALADALAEQIVPA